MPKCDFKSNFSLDFFKKKPNKLIFVIDLKSVKFVFLIFLKDKLCWSLFLIKNICEWLRLTLIRIKLMTFQVNDYL